METWNIQELTGYEPMTTFYEDFSIADKFGVEAIKDTYKAAFEGCQCTTGQALSTACRII